MIQGIFEPEEGRAQPHEVYTDHNIIHLRTQGLTDKYKNILSPVLLGLASGEMNIRHPRC
jgi:hypothetical protein